MVSVKAMLAKVTFTGDACGGVDIDLGSAGAVGSVGTVVGLIALFSSYDHVSLPHRQLPLQQQWGIWLIALSLPLLFADAQLAARSRCRDADRALKAENEAAEERNRAAKERNKSDRERNRVARLDALRNRLDRGRLAFQLDPSPINRRRLQRLLNLLNSPAMAELYRGG